jgi:hypothetical protein
MDSSNDGPTYRPPRQRTEVQKYAFTKSIVLAIVCIVGGIFLLILGLTSGRNLTIPIVAIVVGIAVLIFDRVTSSRRKRRQL